MGIEMASTQLRTEKTHVFQDLNINSLHDRREYRFFYLSNVLLLNDLVIVKVKVIFCVFSV